MAWQLQLEYLKECCFQNATNSDWWALYERRLAFWTVGDESISKHQARITFQDFRVFYVKPRSFKYVLEGFSCCEYCYRQVLGLKDTKWKEHRKNWLSSGGKLTELETKHSLKERAAPITLAIMEYFKRLGKVESLCLKILFWHFL